MSVNEDWKEKLSNSELAAKSRLYLFAQQFLDKHDGLVFKAQKTYADFLESRNPDMRELFGRDAIEIEAAKWIRQVCKDRSGDALKRDEARGQTPRADIGHAPVAPSSPVKPYVHPSLERHTENGNGGAGQSVIAGNVQRTVAPSPSVSMLGHNKPPKVARPAIDPKRFMQAQQANKAQIAEAISDIWKLSDGKQVCKLPFYELKRRDQDGIASRTLREAAQKKYANLDETRSPQDLLSENELKECFERVKQLRVAEAA